MAYAELIDLKTYLGITAGEAEADAVLDRTLLAAESAIDRATGRCFAVAADTTRSFGPCAVGGQLLMLDAELASLTSITNGDGEAVDINVVRTMPRNAGPYFALSLPWSLSWVFDDIDAEITVTGRWGYSVEPPADITQAAIRLAGYWYRLKEAQVFDVTASPETGQLVIPKGMPADVMPLLARYRRVTL